MIRMIENRLAEGRYSGRVDLVRDGFARVALDEPRTVLYEGRKYRVGQIVVLNEKLRRYELGARVELSEEDAKRGFLQSARAQYQREQEINKLMDEWTKEEQAEEDDVPMPRVILVNGERVE